MTFARHWSSMAAAHAKRIKHHATHDWIRQLHTPRDASVPVLVVHTAVVIVGIVVIGYRGGSHRWPCGTHRYRVAKPCVMATAG
jgi:hypothetical protein